ncbi:hypothetical protein K503DRAFT_661449, partial [Rhizopogon vinicolor AM-OR11-026]
AITHDEQKYPNPDEFKPEIFLHEDGSLTNDAMPLSFGWGRRIFLATFSVQKTFDEHGEGIPVVPKFSTGLIIHPEIFPYQIVPR